jgi:hypothetical protein
MMELTWGELMSQEIKDIPLLPSGYSALRSDVP